MEKILWNDDYCTGISEIDSQHKRIVDQINFLINNLDRKDKSSTNKEIVSMLDKYGNEHFATEEGYMRSYNYPEIEEHIKIHDSFKMNTVKSAVKVIKGQEDVPEETIQFLRNWWSNHIIKTDMKFKDYIRNK
jgi:hemerythrin